MFSTGKFIQFSKEKMGKLKKILWKRATAVVGKGTNCAKVLDRLYLHCQTCKPDKPLSLCIPQVTHLWSSLH